MVGGKGSPIGPDLSTVAHDMTVAELQEALAQPGSRIAPGYELVQVELRSGKIVRGFARGRSQFDIQVEGLDGELHAIQQSEIARIRQEKGSLMQPVKASAEETQNLVAYLASLKGISPGALGAGLPPEAGGIDFARILHPGPGEWPTYNGKLNANRYSELTEINSTNVNRLGLKWVFAVPLWKQFLPDTAYFNENMRYFGLEVTPLVVDGIMYISG